MPNYMTELSPDNNTHVYQIKDKEATPIDLLKDTVGWVGKNKAEKTVVTGNLPQYNMQLYIDGELEADKEYKLSFVSDGAYKLYPNEALFTSNASFTTVVGQNEVSVTTKSAVSKSTSGQYENNLGWRVLKNGATLTTAPTLTNIMLRDASITDDTFEPYHESVEEVVEQVYADNGVLGAKNFFRKPYYDGTSKTSNGVTFTVNSDGSITVDTNGAASTGEASFRLMRYDRDQDLLNMLNGKALKKSGTSGDVIVQGYWGGATHREDDITVNTTSMTNWNFAVYVASGKTINNVTVYPMLRLASDTDSTYQPYAMTNRELTEMLTPVESAVTNIVSGATAEVNNLIKIGKLVYCTLILSGVTASGWSSIAVVPDGFRPKYACRVKNGTGTNTSIQVNSNGIITPTDNLSSNGLALSATWITP